MQNYNSVKIERFKKYVSIFLALLMLLWYVVYPAVSFAQVVPTDTPTPTPAPSTSTTPTDTPTPTPDPSTSSAPTPTPTPDPSLTSPATPTPTPTIDPSLVSPTPTPDLTNSNISNNNASSSAVTGNNTLIATGSASTTNPGQSSSQSNGSSSGNNSNSGVATGNATSAVTQTNSINTTAINSNVINQTLNIFVAQNGSINLSDPLTIASNAILSHPSDPVVNVLVTNVNNFTYITNDIASRAITGSNSVSTADQSASINTGNAYSAVSLLNQVNFTVVNSQIHVITINIFGTLNGNIILPNINAPTNCPGCGVSVNANNNATVTNNITSTANSGNNTATASGNLNVTTGNSSSAVNDINLINTNLYGTTAQVLFINNFGTWTGNFIGWGNLGPQAGGTSLIFYSLGTGSGTLISGCSSCSGSLNASSSANVTNNISSLANTGGNSINSNGNATIITGNAFSIVSLLNFINSNFVNSFGFFTFLNIFGNWVGNIGGQKEFAALNAKVTDTPQVQSQNNSSQTSSSISQELGGTLQVISSNNVNNFVYPGDTVTFFVKINNPGTGKVYGTKLVLALIKNGKLMGGTSYDIGDIDAHKGKGLTTGFVLSKNAPGGSYIAEAYAYGTVGPNDTKISASSQNGFNIYGNFAQGPKIGSPTKVVLGSQYPNRLQKAAQTDYALYTLLAVLIAYMTIRLSRQRKQLREMFGRNISVKEKIVSLRMFIL